MSPLTAHPLVFKIPPLLEADTPSPPDFVAASGGAGSSLAGRVVPMPPSADIPAIGSYAEITCRIPKESLELIEGKMLSLKDYTSQLEILIALLDEGKFDKIHPNAFYYLLRGVKEGKNLHKYLLRVCEIDTLRYQGIKFEGVDILSVTGDIGKKDGNSPITWARFIEFTGGYLNPENLSAYCEALFSLPKIDRMLLLFDYPEERSYEKMKALGELTTISQVFKAKQNFTVLRNLFRVDKTSCVSASSRVYSLLLQVLYGENAVTLNPVLGVSSPSQIRANGLTHTRDVSYLYLVPIEDEKSRLHIEPKADGFVCLADDFKYHDHYHGFILSAMSKTARKIAVEVSDKIYALAESKKELLCPQDYKATRSMRWTFLDMDFPDYYLNIRKSKKASEELLLTKSIVDVLLSYENKLNKHLILKDKKSGFTEGQIEVLRAQFDAIKRLHFETSESFYEAALVALDCLPHTPAYQRAKSLVSEKIQIDGQETLAFVEINLKKAELLLSSCDPKDLNAIKERTACLNYIKILITQVKASLNSPILKRLALKPLFAESS